MRGKRAKQIRKIVYGEDGAPRYRKYENFAGTITADPMRRMYKKTKKNYKENRDAED